MLNFQVIDNSGAMLAEVINVYKVKHKAKKSVGFGTIGESNTLACNRHAREDTNMDSC